MPDDGGRLDATGSSSSETGVLDGHGGLLLMTMYDDTCILANGRRHTVDWWGSRPGGGGVMNRRRDYSHVVDRRLLIFGTVEDRKINVAERQQELVVKARQCTVGR